MGDVLWMEPIIAELSKKYRKIIVVSRFNELFDNYPAKNVQFKYDLSIFEKLLYHFERIINISIWFVDLEMAYENNPIKHFLHAYQEKAKLPELNVYPAFFLTEKEKNDFMDYDKYAVLHITALAPKNYRKIYGINWNDIVQHLTNVGYKIIIIGSLSNTANNVVEFHGNIRQLISLIYNCNLFIGLDSGPSHIAVAINKPSIIFFGAINPQFRHFTDIRDNLLIMQGKCEFAGCYHKVTNTIYGTTCQLVGNQGTPKCAFHLTTTLINNINYFII